MRFPGLLRGHSKGVLSLAWCPRDPSLLLSGGKDDRAILWNVNSGESLGDLSPASNWIFDVQVRAAPPHAWPRTELCQRLR